MKLDIFKNFHTKKKINYLTRCGIILFNEDLDSIVLVENKYLYDEIGMSKWGIPKGVLEQGETFHECAMREVYEETGLQITLKKNQPFLKLNSTYYFPIRIDIRDIMIPKDNQEIKSSKLMKLSYIRSYIRYNKDLKLLMVKFINRAKQLALMNSTFRKKKNIYVN